MKTLKNTNDTSKEYLIIPTFLSKYFSEFGTLLIVASLYVVISSGCNEQDRFDNDYYESLAHDIDTTSEGRKSMISKLGKFEIEFDDAFYEESFVRNVSSTINSKHKLNVLNLWNKDVRYTFPFKWRAYNEPMWSIDCIALFNYKIGQYRALILGYKSWGTNDNMYQCYLFTYTVEGHIIDIMQLPHFAYGVGDNPQFVKSNFTKKYGSSGFAEIKVDDRKIYFNNTYLRLYNNGTEEIANVYNTYFINKNGTIVHENSEELSDYYYKDHKLNTDLDRYISRFTEY